MSRLAHCGNILQATVFNSYRIVNTHAFVDFFNAEALTRACNLSGAVIAGGVVMIKENWATATVPRV